MNTKRVTLIPGDGIGPEITDAVTSIFRAAQVPIEWEVHQAGFCALDHLSTPLPTETLESIKRNKIALKGPCTTPIGEGFRSINVELRQKLDLYANVRPAKTLPGVKGRYEDIDLIIFRENTEGMYRGEEYWLDDAHSGAKSIGLVTKKATERLVRYAFEYSIARGRKKITIVHKANILKLTNGLFLETAKSIAKEYEGKLLPMTRSLIIAAYNWLHSPPNLMSSLP